MVLNYMLHPRTRLLSRTSYGSLRGTARCNELAARQFILVRPELRCFLSPKESAGGKEKAWPADTAVLHKRSRIYA